jgi:hypothetical protein
MRRILIFSICLAAAMLPAAAAPYVPDDDSQVLERLPSQNVSEDSRLSELKIAARDAPQDPEAAAKLAQAYYQKSRRESDPRYLGYAQAALARWWDVADAPNSVLLARASILQSGHAFERALADLDRVIAHGDNAQALLVRATVQTVRGNYDAARADCAALRGLTADVVALGCAAGLEALTSNHSQAKAALEYGLENLAGDQGDVQAWLHSLMAELLHRQGDANAELHFKAAIAADPHDNYTIGAYCDWLLDQRRPDEVIAMTRDASQVDGLLLRLALAQKMSGAAAVEASTELLRTRFAASAARGDTVHRREEARFHLALSDNPSKALALALANWAVQREPADLRILAEAAAATRNAAARQTVGSWIAQTGLVYRAAEKAIP